jgi:hypothetical protein
VHVKTDCSSDAAPLGSPRPFGRVVTLGKGRCLMALGFYFTHGGFTPDKYDQVIKQLDAAGAGSPKGRSIHVALESNGEIQVFDVWDSQEEFDAFGETLLPILAAAGIELNDPMVASVHNVISG